MADTQNLKANFADRDGVQEILRLVASNPVAGASGGGGAATDFNGVLPVSKGGTGYTEALSSGEIDMLWNEVKEETGFDSSVLTGVWSETELYLNNAGNASSINLDKNMGEYDYIVIFAWDVYQNLMAGWGVPDSIINISSNVATLGGLFSPSASYHVVGKNVTLNCYGQSWVSAQRSPSITAGGSIDSGSVAPEDANLTEPQKEAKYYTDNGNRISVWRVVGIKIN